jgi:CHAD domain-containing protein
LRKRRYAEMLKAFEQAQADRLDQRLFAMTVLPEGKKVRRRPLWREAAEAMVDTLEELRSYDRRLKRLSPRQQHQLRIGLKNLRYLGEFFEKFYGRRMTRLIVTVAGLQDLLGLAHDADVYEEWLMGRDASGVAKALVKDIRRRRLQSLKQASRLWKGFHKLCRRRAPKWIKKPARIGDKP